MQKFKKIPSTEEFLTAWFASWYNKTLMRKVVIRAAWNQHLTTGRETHVAELFGHFVIIDSRERADINKAGQVGKMEVIDMMKASIWSSTAHRAYLESGIVNTKAEDHPYKLPNSRKKNINKK